MHSMHVWVAVIPLGQSYGTEPLIYFCGEDFRKQIHIGSLVEIPLGKKLEYGIIASIEKVRPANLPDTIKSVSLVICSRPLLAPYQCEAICTLSEYLFEPIHKVAFFFLPKSLIRFLEKHAFSGLEENTTHLKRRHAKRNIHFIRSGQVTPSIIEKYMEGKRVVIIFPDAFLATHFLTHTTLIREDMFVLENVLTPRGRIQSWKAIERGEYPIVIGTRKLLWYNLGNYDHILYIEDAFADTYFQFPLHIRFLDVLQSFGDSGPDVTILSSTPSIYALTGLEGFEKHVSL